MKVLGRKSKFSEIFFSNILSGAISALLSFFLSLWVYRETTSGLFKNRIPLAGDGLITKIYLQEIEQSSYLSVITQNLHSRNYGWPGELDFSSFPIGNLQEVLAIKFFSQITGISDPSQLVHIFSIIKAPIIATCTYFLARLIGVNRWYSIFTGVVFSLNTFNLIRGEGHFFLALTWALPIGIASIFLAFRQDQIGIIRTKKRILLISILAFSSSMSGFYVNFFLLILTFSGYLFLFASKMVNNQKEKFSKKISSSFSESISLLSVLFIFILGFLAQTIPTLIRSENILSLVGIADRGFTESIIYSGTPESLFFDFYSFGLQILNRPDLAAYLQSRISWEASQIGALSGLFFAVILVYITALGLKNLASPNSSWRLPLSFKNSSFTFLYLMTLTSLAFYFVSPLNFGVSRMIPQIRAWGRLSMIISLLTLIFLGLVLTKLRIKGAFIQVLVILVLLVPIIEIGNFREYRPSSESLNQLAQNQDSQMDLTLEALKSKFDKNCSLVNLPIYPFPEFDRTDDQNIDYGQLELPTRDEGYFRWSYAGIKATANFSSWQPLVSEFPPFARASIGNQIEYARSLGACGAVIDRSYLTPSEINSLNSLRKNYGDCMMPLGGTQFNEIERYVSFDFKDKNCKRTQNNELKVLAFENKKSIFLWRIDESSQLPYSGTWQVFPTEEVINGRVVVKDKSEATRVLLRVRGFSSQSLLGSKTTICLSSLSLKQPFCREITLNMSGIAEVKLPTNLLSGRVEKFAASLDGLDISKLSGWGVQIGLPD